MVNKEVIKGIMKTFAEAGFEVSEEEAKEVFMEVATQGMALEWFGKMIQKDILLVLAVGTTGYVINKVFLEKIWKKIKEKKAKTE